MQNATPNTDQFETSIARKLWQFAEIAETLPAKAVDTSCLILSAMARLDRHQHQVVFHMLVNGKSCDETARVLGMEANDIQTHLQQARSAMHNLMLAQGAPS